MRVWLHGRNTVIALLLAGVSLAQAAAGQGEPLRTGVVIPSVTCGQAKEQSYALYLPSNYDPKRAWPIVYALDPVARGSMPVEMLRDAAEKYGYIVVGSNNSRNGPGKIQYDAMNAMWGDTHQRFTIDDKRVYLTGFSGGARAATMIAKGCGTCVAGIIAHGAGFLREMPPTQEIRYSYFAAIGTRDYNYPELVQLADTLDEMKVAHRLRRFDGTHQWGTPEVWMDAVEWMEVRAMKENRRGRDPAFAADYGHRQAERAAAFEKAGNAYAAKEEYVQLAADLAGLADVSAYVAQAERLQALPAVAEGRKREERDFRKQTELIGALYENLDRLKNEPRTRRESAAQLRAALREAATAYERMKDQPEGLVLGRALNQMGAGIISLAEAEMFRDGKDVALLCYEIYADGHPKLPWPQYQIARLAAELGQKKKAIRALQRALDNGMPESALKRFATDFAAVAAEKDFQKLAAKKS